jgi:hypothetical protein
MRQQLTKRVRAPTGRSGTEIAAIRVQAEFSKGRLETMRLKPALVCALGVNGAAT